MAKQVPYEPLLTVAEAAEYVCRCRETIRRAVRARELACVRGPKRASHLRFRLSDLNAWIKSHEQPARRLA